jgi:hypothetical protein
MLCSSAQRLLKGNTLICSANQGKFTEVTYDKEIVWEYDNPYPLLGSKMVTEAIRYPTDYPGIPETLSINVNPRWLFFNNFFIILRDILQKGICILTS